MGQVYDLAIVGGGPSGLSAAINGASEGLKVLLIDENTVLGGQARESSAIENYPGFPDGITGDHLMTNLTRQAAKFDADFRLPNRIGLLNKDGDLVRLQDEFGENILARTVLLTLGLSYRRLQADGLNAFLGTGAFYGMPAGRSPTHKCNVVVVGGANSSGQAVLHLAKNSHAMVRLVSRSPLEKGMSQYLIDRIRACPNVEVMEGCEVKACIGASTVGHRMHELEIVWDGVGHTIPADYLFLFIGAIPRTAWLGQTLTLEKGFIPCGQDVGASLPYETSVAGVFAAGDIRYGSTKRIATAVGEGVGALQMIHRRLSERQ